MPLDFKDHLQTNVTSRPEGVESTDESGLQIEAKTFFPVNLKLIEGDWMDQILAQKFREVNSMAQMSTDQPEP